VDEPSRSLVSSLSSAIARALRRRVWELRHRCSAYDACYVALAETLGAELLTTDTRLARTAYGLVDVIATS